MSNNAHELSNRLLNALDNNYNVVDMHTVNEIISILERINITKELLETTRLGKHVNELRRKTTEPTLARRAKVLVKRWRDLVIPNVASPGHTGSNRSSAERQIRRLGGGTPLTSPALSRQVVSPAVPSPRPPSRPAWGGYESDSQDVILVDDEPPPPPVPNPLTNTHKPLTPPVKRPPSPELLHDEKKAKRDKKPRKKRGHSRAGAGAEAGEGAWGGRNGTNHERRRNGTRQPLDSYAALVNRMPPAGAKKVKTTKELLEQIQSRGSKPATSPGSPRSPASPDVMLIEPDAPAQVKVESPLRNGGKSPRAETPVAAYEPLEDEREYAECTCGDVQEGEGEGDPACPAAVRTPVRPATVYALHHAYLPGVNGTRAPLHPHRFAVRPPEDPERPGLFASVVPLYKYSDYADDYCVKNMSRVPLCTHLSWTEFAPAPPDPPPPPSPPPIRPYPIDDTPVEEEPADDDDSSDEKPTSEQLPAEETKPPVKAEPAETVEAEMVGVPTLEPSERLKAPLLTAEDESAWSPAARPGSPGAVLSPGVSAPAHRTVERTKGGGMMLRDAVASAIRAVPYDYNQLEAAPVLSAETVASDAAVETALAEATADRDDFGRPVRSARFAEWHECAQLGSLTALPYVVID